VIDDEEFAVDRRCIPAPVRDESGQTIAAISLSSVPASLPAEEFAHAARLVTQFAMHISRTFGATG
jgi:DNA-binding IclR family transcriptional regulator